MFIFDKHSKNCSAGPRSRLVSYYSSSSQCFGVFSLFFCYHLTMSALIWSFSALQLGFLKALSTLKSKASNFTIFTVKSIFEKLRLSGLKAKSEIKRILDVSALICTWSSCVHGDRCTVFLCLKVHYWSIVHQFLLSSLSILCSPFFLSILWASFIKVLRSKGAAAAWGCLGSWGFDLSPFMLQHRAIHLLNLTQQYDRAGRINAWNSAAGFHLCIKRRG